ncbi:MAG: sigma-70 family RNA polymerase sigma factor [Ilumatobacteraceae bacterium]
MCERGDRVQSVSSPVASPEWAAVYEANAGHLIRLATVLVGPDDAPDLVADAVLRAVTSKSWSRVESPAGYLTRVTVNLAHDRRSQTARRTQREARSARLSERTAARASDGDVDTLIVVRAALASLSAGQLVVIQLHYWEDMTLAQVAERLGIREGTVRRQLDRAKHHLRDLLNSEGTPL